MKQIAYAKYSATVMRTVAHFTHNHDKKEKMVDLKPPGMDLPVTPKKIEILRFRISVLFSG